MGEDKTAEAVQYGLALDLPGAPATAHIVSGFEGQFSAEEPRLLEECRRSAADGEPAREISLAEAKELHQAEGVPLVLVQRKGEKGGWKRLPRKKAGDENEPEADNEKEQ